MSRQLRICVVGAGIMGMSTAVMLQKSDVSADVTVMADRFSPNTTSDVAGGFWLPHKLASTPISLIRRWGGATFKHFEDIFMSEDCAQSGVTQTSGYVLYNSTGNEMDPYWKDMVPNFCVVSPKDLQQFPSVKEGIFFTSYICETTVYLNRLTDSFRKNNGRIIKKKLSSLEEIADDYDIIVNCSGIGSHQLMKDEELNPLRGQVIRLKAPWIKCFYLLVDEDSYLLPGVSRVTLGGVHQHARWDDTECKTDTEAIMKKGSDFFPFIKGAEVIDIVAGLRPARNIVRLERGQDIITSSNKKVPVIHNYGHGGAGITLHYGCAMDVVDLVKTTIMEKLTKAKL